MQIVITEGQIQLEPVPGQEEGTVNGYLLKAKDIESKVEVVIAMAHENAAKLGAVIVEHTGAHPAGPAQPTLAVVPASALGHLPKVPNDHLAKGGGRRG